MHIWSDNQKKVIRKLKKNTLVLCDKYKLKADENIQIYNFMMILCIVLAPISGFISSVNTILYPDQEIFLPILASALSFISGVFLGITKFYNHQEKSLSNLSVARDFQELHDELETQMLINEHDIKFENYIKHIYKSISKIRKKNPTHIVDHTFTSRNPLFKKRKSLSSSTDKKKVIQDEMKNYLVDACTNINIIEHMLLYELNRYNKSKNRNLDEKNPVDIRTYSPISNVK